jgi:hypothetical protein
MGFLNFIKEGAPESVFAPQCGCYEHEEAGETKRVFPLHGTHDADGKALSD